MERRDRRSSWRNNAASPTGGGVAFNDKRVLSWSDDGGLELWSQKEEPAWWKFWATASDDAPLAPMRHDGRVFGAAFNGDRILSWGEDQTVRLWDATTGEPLTEPLQHAAAVGGATIRGSQILTWSGSEAQLWSAKQGTPIGSPMSHDGAVTGATFYKNDHIASWSQDGTARLWERESTTPVGQPMRHDGPVRGLIVHDDHLMTWSEDATVRIWNAEIKTPSTLESMGLWTSEPGPPLGSPVGEVMRHDAPVVGVGLNRPSTRLMTWSEDASVRLFHPRNGEAVGAPIQLKQSVGGAIFNDGFMEDFYFNWFLIGSVLFFISYTMWATPWVALGFELTPDYYERTRLMGVQFFIGQVPYLIAPWFLAFMAWSYFSSMASGASVLALIIALTAATLGVIPAIFLREKPLPPQEESTEGSGGVIGAITEFLRAMMMTLTSGPFLLLCAATFLVFNGFQLIASFQSYVLIYYVMGGDQAGGAFWLGWTGTTQILATFGVIPFVTWLANKIGKRRAFLVATGIATVGYGLKWFCYSTTTPWLILLPTPLIAFSLGGLFTLMPSMIADVVDYDELTSHQRREGMFGSVYWLMVKLGVSVALIAGGILLNETGFRVELGSDQSAETLLWLRIYDVIVPMITSVLAMTAMYFYPLVESRALEIRAELDARHAAVEGASS